MKTRRYEQTAIDYAALTAQQLSCVSIEMAPRGADAGMMPDAGDPLVLTLVQRRTGLVFRRRMPERFFTAV